MIYCGGSKVKKALAILLSIFLVLALASCSGKNDETQPEEETPVQNVATTYTPLPTTVPTATPFPRIAPENYVLQWKNDAKRGFNFMLPTHWVAGESGDRYCSYYEPVPDGESGFRVCFVNKKKNSEPDVSAMRNELRKLISDMESIYDGFECDGTISRDYSLVRFKGYSSLYTFLDEYGVKMKGLVVIATYNRRIYCMNFSGPEARFEDMMPVCLKIMESMSRVTSTS